MIKIKPFDKVGIDDRGYTYEYFHERYGRHLISFRKAGSVSGRHYHKGISLTKNPEILVLVHGNITLNYRNVNDTEIIKQQVEGPVQIEIQPYVWHELVANTDCCFIELNSLSEHQADSFTS